MILLSGITKPPVQLMGLGATDPAAPPGAPLSVKEYTVSGVKVWASVGSPISDRVLRQLKLQINRFGAGLTADGLIGPKTVDAVKKIAADNSSDPRAHALIAISVSPEVLARSAVNGVNMLLSLGNELGLPAAGSLGPYPSSGGGSGGGSGTTVATTSTSSGGQSSFPDNLPMPTDFPGSGDHSIAPIKPALKWPYIIGGIAVVGGLAFIIWTVLGPHKSKNTIYRQSNAWA